MKVFKIIITKYHTKNILATVTSTPLDYAHKNKRILGY